MTRKPLKLTLIAVAAVLLALTAGVVFASTKTQSAGLPEYVGSQACLGCHSDKFIAWEGSLHATYVEALNSPADWERLGLPSLEGVAPELLEELSKADYYFHDRFLAVNPKTGELMYLGVDIDPATHKYVANPSRKGTSMDASCGGCHAGRDYQTNPGREIGVGCESCHGPGRAHILGKGDPSLIVNSANPVDNCAACHSGFNTKPGAARYPIGYRPTMKLEEVGFVAKVIDPNAAPLRMHHDNTVGQWQASRHAKATQTMIDHGPTYPQRAECIWCHSTSAGLLIPQLEAKGQKWDATKHLVNDGVTCVACHDPHGSAVPGQLKKDASQLCLDCHTVGRTNRAPVKIGTARAPHSPQGDMVAGTGALGIPDTVGAHSKVTCIECHMGGKTFSRGEWADDLNHSFKVLMPQDVIGDKNRIDSCTKCHANSSAESRAVYLTLWSESVNSRLAAISADVDAIDAALKANPNALTKEQIASYQNWRANFWYVRKDKSGGAHNFEYAIKILAQTQKEIKALKGALK